MLNAAHALHRMLAAVLPDARRPAAGRAPRRACGRRATRSGRAGDACPAARPTSPSSAAGRTIPAPPPTGTARIGFEPAIDVHGIEVGDATQVRTQIPATARAMLSMRLAPGQASAALWPVLERRLLAAAPDGADVHVTLNNACEPPAPNRPTR